MGLLLSLPLTGLFGSIATSCIAGVAFCFTSTAASMFCKSCNCNSSIATRVGFAIIFCLNSMFAWLMKTPFAINLIQKWSLDYIKLECDKDRCYGVLAVHRICFALTLFHAILGASLIGVKDTRDKRAAFQNGWWGPKTLLWLVLVVITFFIPNGFFIFWSNYVSLIGATIFILLGLVLLVDAAHSWSEMCLENWETSDSNMWQWILIGSTAGMYVATIALTGILYAFFAGSGCTLNQFFISFNLALCVIITVMCIHPIVQEYNPRSGLAQSSMVAAYCTYLIMSAVGNHQHTSCNPLRKPGTAEGAQMTTIILGAIFTFLAIAYSTSRAATQSRALVGKHKRGVQLPIDDALDHSEMGFVSTQPGRTESPRYQALLAAVEAGAIPASALEEDEEGEEEEEEVTGDNRDDERSGTRYNYSWFHFIFALGAMYVAMLLTDWNVVRETGASDPDQDVYIGRSETAMWMRIVSSWVCMILYMWSLLAPVIMPDRFGDV